MAIDVAALDAKINDLVANPRVSYSIGDKSVSASDYLRQLLEIRANLAQIPQVELEMITFDQDIQLSGHDDTQTSVPL